jgi:hypothetical protein
MHKVRFIKIFPLLYIFMASWTDFYSLNDYLTLPNIAIMVTVLIFSIYLLLFRQKLPPYPFKVEESLIIFLFVSITFSTVFNINAKTAIYLLVYLYVCFFMYFFMNYVIMNFVSYRDILNTNLYAVFIVGCFGTVEFLLQVLFSYDIQDHIPHRMYNDGMYMEGIPRVNGFSEEPTYLAWYLNTMGTFAVWWLLKKTKKKWVRVIVLFPITFCYITTFSGAGIPLLVIFSTIFFVILNKNRLEILRKIVPAICFIYVLLLSYNVDIALALEPLLYKSTLQQEGDIHRPEIWQKAADLFYSSPIAGQGLGYYSTTKDGSPINFFLATAVEVGIVPVLIFSIFFAYFLVKIWYYKGEERNVLLVGISCGISHLWTQSLFYQPCIWLIVIFANKAISNYNQLNNNRKLSESQLP